MARVCELMAGPPDIRCRDATETWLAAIGGHATSAKVYTETVERTIRPMRKMSSASLDMEDAHAAAILDVRSVTTHVLTRTAADAIKSCRNISKKFQALQKPWVDRQHSDYAKWYTTMDPYQRVIVSARSSRLPCAQLRGLTSKLAAPKTVSGVISNPGGLVRECSDIQTSNLRERVTYFNELTKVRQFSREHMYGKSPIKCCEGRTQVHEPKQEPDCRRDCTVPCCPVGLHHIQSWQDAFG